MSDAPRRMSTIDRFADTAVTVASELLARDANRGERSYSIVRLVLCLVLLVRALVVDTADVLAGRPKDVVGVLLVVVGAGFSITNLAMAPPTGKVRTWVSTFLDALLVHGALLLIVLDPEDWFVGLLGSPYPLLVLVAATGAGLRLSRTLAVLVGLVHLLAFSSLLALERVLWMERMKFGTGGVVFALVCVGGGVGIAVAFAARTRRLVAEGAAAALETERVRNRLGAYLPAEVIAEALAAREMKLGGARRDVAVLFSDLRGFTSASEGKTPEAVVAELNAYLEEMVEAINAAGGVVDKYIGDGIMAVFGAPNDRPDDARRALQAARGMTKALKRHNVSRSLSGLPPLHQGIGVHFGPVVAGNVGTLSQAQYTVIGDVVNVASRLESATKELGLEVLASAAVVAQAQKDGQPVEGLREVGEVRVRGRESSLRAFTLEL